MIWIVLKIKQENKTINLKNDNNKVLRFYIIQKNVGVGLLV